MSALLSLLLQAAHPEGEHALEGAHGAAAAEAGTHAAGAAEGPGEILMHHVLDVHYGHLYVGGLDVGPTKHLLFFVVVAALVITIVRLALRGYHKDSRVPTGLAAAVEGLVVFVRDEIAEKNIGHGEGAKYTPLLLSFFFFILTGALFGLVPMPAYEDGHFSLAGVTSTANLSVTLGLAIVAFVAMQWAGISKHGLIAHYRGMVPPGLPILLVPLMIPIEIMGMFARPFALMIRLFANMLAGHMVITTLLLLIPLMAGVKLAFGIGMIPISLALGLFIMVLELLVSFVQAYIFTLLTSLFIGMSVHPAH
jgi:F-type H+-transporting ATPase subunit a